MSKNLLQKQLLRFGAVLLIVLVIALALQPTRPAPDPDLAPTEQTHVLIGEIDATLNRIEGDATPAETVEIDEVRREMDKLRNLLDDQPTDQ